MSNTVRLDIIGDASSLERTTKRAGVAVAQFGDEAEKHAKRTSNAFAGIGTAALAMGAVVGKALFDFAGDSIKAFTDAQESQARLNDAFERFPKLADVSADSLRNLNTELEKKTVFDDDALASGQAVLAQFNLTGKQIQDLTPLLADYAAKTGQDIPTAAESLGKAFLGQTRALKELGINYQSTGDQATDVANITDLLREKVGGFAEQQGKTAAGQAKILSNQFGELKETIGEKLLPVMLKAAEVGLKVVDWISQNKDVVLPLVGVIAAVTVAQYAWNLAMSLNPIGLIIIGIAALVAAIIFLVKNWDTAWKAIKDIAGGVWDWFKTLPSMFKDLGLKLVDILVWPYKTAFNLVADAWNATIGKLSWTVPTWVPIIGGNTIAAPKLHHFHSGGVVPGAPGSEMLAVLQAGERVIPAGQAGAATIVLRSSGRRTDDLVLQLFAEALRGQNLKVVTG